MRILSNTGWFENRSIDGKPVAALRISSTAGGMLKSLWRGLSADAVVVNEAHRELLSFCLMRWLLRRRKLVIIAFDQIFEPVQGIRGRFRAAIIRWLLRQVEHFIFLYKEIDEVSRIYGIPRDRTSYVTFKVNGWDDVMSHPVRDDGYVLACGRSRRDYKTYCEAVSKLPVRAVILAPTGTEAREHGTVDELTDVPSNVEVVRDDGSWSSWLHWLAGARVVAVPILPPTLAASGIGTYLVAMALGKCVVITDSPATRGILGQDQAVVVPPLDAAALRSGLKRVLDDDRLRTQIAEGGRAYALSLGDETRLANDVFAIAEPIITAGPTR